MHDFKTRSSWWMLLVSVVVVFAASPVPLEAAGPAAPNGPVLQEPPPPANRLMFSPLPRQLALFKGSEVVVPSLTALVLVAFGLFQLRDPRTHLAALALYGGTFLFYFAWVLHKWSLSGRMTIFQGHLLAWFVAALGVCLGLHGLMSLVGSPRVSRRRGCTSLPWLFALALFLTLGLATGTATIFEVCPILCGINPQWHLILAFVAIGSLFSAMSLLTVARSLT